MKFKSNARWGEPKENGTIFELKNNKLGIKVHRIVHIENTWFLSCYALNISQMNLFESDFNKAVKKSKLIINQKIGELMAEYENIVGDDVIKIE